MIEKVIQRIIDVIPASSGDDLTGFVMDADHYFSEQGAFASASVEQGVESESLINISLVLAPHVDSLQAVSRGLQDAWQSVRYSYFAASSVIWYREATVLRFITVITADQFHVTGTAMASGPQYAMLVESFERDFRRTQGPLPTMVGRRGQPPNNAVQGTARCAAPDRGR